MHRTLLTLLLATVALPASAQTWVNLQDGRFESRFVMDTNNDGDYDTDGAPASWSSPAGILWGRDHAPDILTEGLLKLIDNRNANGHWTLGFAAVTPRIVGLVVRNHDTDDAWVLVTGTFGGQALWAAAPDGETRYAKAGYGTSVSILHAFDAEGRIPREHFVTQSADTADPRIDPEILRFVSRTELP